MGRGQELLNAAREGDKRNVERILGQITNISGPFTSLRRGAGVNVQDDNGYTPLHQACLNGHKDIVRTLLSVGASPCMVDKKGATPLHLAAFNGDTDVCWMLLDHSNPPVNIDQLTSDHETALLIAAQFGFVNVVAQLISRGADVTIKNNNDESALDLAAQYGRLATVQHLLQVRPQLVDQYRHQNCRGVVFTSTPLHRASKNGRKDVVTALIDAGMDPNVRTDSGTPLHEAARFGKPSVVRILLNKGADLHARDSNGRTVYKLFEEYPEEATRKVRKVIREYDNIMGAFDSDKELPPFPVPDYSPDAVMATTETQKNTNNNDSFLSPSSSSLTKNHSQSFVKKLATKCLGLKAKFNSAPNISNSAATEVGVKSKQSDHKMHTNTILIGNSKFFKMLSKKEESGEILCNDEFDTISLDRLNTLNRDSVVNRSNRSCPGFKTSLPNISENNELSDSQESIAESVVITELNCDKSDFVKINEAVNCNMNLNIFEPREVTDRQSVNSVISAESTNLVNECYESYEFSKKETVSTKPPLIPTPPPRPTMAVDKKSNENIYENVVLEIKTIPKPAARIHIPVKPLDEEQKKTLYENISVVQEKKPEPLKRSLLTKKLSSESYDEKSIHSTSSTLSSDSMIDETNLEDILLSQKSKSFRHGKTPSYSKLKGSSTQSIASDYSETTEASALENVDCSCDIVEKPMYLSMTGTLPHKKPESYSKKKVLFRHKTFTNMEADRLSLRVKDLPQWNNSFLKETLAHYHIRGTGHCIYNAPTVQEFIYIFNRDTLYSDVPPFTKVPNNKRDSYFETAICFCRPRPPKFHSSAEDLIDKTTQADNEKVIIDMDVLKNRSEMLSSSFQCYCDSGTCSLHSTKRKSPVDLIVKFSAIKRSISTPDITLESSPYSTASKLYLPKNKSVPSNLEEPYAVISVEDIIARNSNQIENIKDPESPIYTQMSQFSTLSSSASARPYSIKDIAEVISLNDNSTSSTLSHASGVHLPLRKSSSSEYSGHMSLYSCKSDVTIKSDASFKSCLEESSEDSDNTLHSDGEDSDAETVKSESSTTKRPWVHSNSFRFGSHSKPEIDVIVEENSSEDKSEFSSSKYESGICLEGSESSSSEDEDDSGIPRADADVSLDCASLERVSGLVGGVRSGSARRRWDEAEGTSEGDALSVSSAASSCAPLLLAHHHEYSKVSPTPPKKPPRRNLSVSPTHANSPSSGYSYELRPHARSQDDLDDIQGAKHYLKHGRSVDQYVDGKLSYSEYEENHNSPRVAPVPNPRPSLKQQSQPVAITAMYENIVIKEQNPRRKLRRNNFVPTHENYEQRMNDNRVRKYSNQEKSSLESLLDDQSMNSPSDCERYYDGRRADLPLSPTHYEQPPTPDHPPPSAKQAENCIHERIRPLSQLIMEVVEEIRIRKMSQGNKANS